jgi:TfoX/Sxy family transcriptional regulator of competence genes
MPYNEIIAIRVRAQIKLFPEDFTEKKMFDGLTFLYHGKMTIGIVKDEIAVRIITSKMETALKNKYVRPMDFTKRPMKEFVYVSEEGFKTETQLLLWVELGLEHAKSKL